MTTESANLKLITENITSLPTLPTVITKISHLLQDPRTSADEIGKAITTDQALASKVLKLVNSAFYGFPGRINTITHALVILGFSTVKNIVLTASIFDAFGGKGDSQAFNIQNFWLHSIGVGATAKTIAQKIGFKLQEECFLGGLIHDIGKIILSQYDKGNMGKLMRTISQKNCLFIDAEKEVIGTTHEELGGWLTAKWNLPKDLAAVVEHHHFPPAAKEHFLMASIVHVSDIFIRALNIGSGGDNKIPKINQQAWNQLNIKDSEIPQLLGKIDEEVEKATIFLSIA
jgi:putative nucleotidyltransferase with HDIG domain